MEELKKRIKQLEDEQEHEFDDLGGDNGGISTTNRYWEIELELEDLYNEVDKHKNKYVLH